MNNFTYAQPTIIEFGSHILDKAVDIIREKNYQKVLVVAGNHVIKTEEFSELKKKMESEGVEVRVFQNVEPNPGTETVDNCAKLARECQAVIGIGGGSVLDTAKGAAMLATNEGSIYDYMLGRGDSMKAVTNPLLPTIMIPTTSGTGSEVSACIVVTDKDRIKDLLLDPKMCPQYAIIDTELMMTMPEYLAAETGLDVLGHAIEGMTTVIATPYSDIQAIEAIKIVFTYLVKSAKEGDEEARAQMAYASMLAGIAQSVGGCCIPHAMSCPLTIHYGIAHGHAVGICQTAAIRLTKNENADRYSRIVNYVWPEAGIAEADAADYLIQKINDLLDELGIRRKYDVEPDDEMLTKLAEDAQKDDGVNVSAIVPDIDMLKKMYVEVLGGV